MTISEGRNLVIRQVADYFAERCLEPVVGEGSNRLHAAWLTEQEPLPIPLCPNQARRGPVRERPELARIAVGVELLRPHCNSCRIEGLKLRLKGLVS